MESFTTEDINRASGPARVSGVDGARAIAMAAVVAEHSGLLSFGWMGVWLFYVISGFVVTGSLLGNRPLGSRSGFIGSFYLRRFARILPAYYLLLVFAISLSVYLGARVPLPALGSLALFFNNFALSAGWGDLPGFNIGNLWTVSVEMQFYAIYGVAFAFAPRRMLFVGLVVLLFLCPLGRLFWGLHLRSRGIPALNAAFDIYSCSFLHFDAFAAGCLLAFERRHVTRRAAYLIVFLGIVSLMLYCGVYFDLALRSGTQGLAAAKNIVSGILFGQYRDVFVYIPVVICAAGLICLIMVKSRLVRLLDWRPLVFVGEVSYGAYLYHAGALTLVHSLLDSILPAGLNRFVEKFLIFGFGLFVTVGLASLSFFCFEKPIVRACGRWLRRRTVLAAAPSTELSAFS